MKPICRCGCGQAFEPMTSRQKNITGHRKLQDRPPEYRAKLDATRAVNHARKAHAEASQRAAEQASAERSPMTCPHRAVRSCNHPRWGGMSQECMMQRSKALCPLGFGVK